MNIPWLLNLRIALFSNIVLSEGEFLQICKDDEKLQNETKGHSSHIMLLLQSIFVLMPP